MDLQVRFNDIDVLGHINNTVYFEYMDLGKSQYISNVLSRNFDFVKEALVIVNINCEFCHISLYNEPLSVETRMDEIGNSSITLMQRIINRDTGEVKCTARTVMVGFNVAKGEKMEISDQVRADVSAFEGRLFPKPDTDRR